MPNSFSRPGSSRGCLAAMGQQRWIRRTGLALHELNGFTGAVGRQTLSRWRWTCRDRMDNFVGADIETPKALGGGGRIREGMFPCTADYGVWKRRELPQPGPFQHFLSVAERFRWKSAIFLLTIVTILTTATAEICWNSVEIFKLSISGVDPVNTPLNTTRVTCDRLDCREHLLWEKHIAVIDPVYLHAEIHEVSK